MSGRTQMRPDRRQFIKVGATAMLVPVALSSPLDARSVSRKGIGLGRDQRFELDWLFRRGAAEGQEATAFDDSGWRKVDLPHDWSIEDLPPGPDRLGPFDAKAESGGDTGFTIGGEGWYRKHFRFSDLPSTAQVEIFFEGISVVSDVWLNGRHLGEHVHSYTPFAYDLTPHLDRDGVNILAVRVRNIGRTSRWYAGSGIYRPVAINVLPTSARIAQWGVSAFTRRLDDASAEIDVISRLEHVDPALMLRTRLYDGSGKKVAEATSRASGEVAQTLHLAKPRPWSPASPSLYTLETSLLSNEKVIDSLDQPFGVRIVTFDPDQGMRINGERIKLRGGCVHHDNGVLGAATFADADERRVLLHKARGFNAFRSSHNPASSAFRAACDRHGMLLIEEAFDTWHFRKRANDYHLYFKDHWEDDLAALVLSARNSPSVIMWSIGNEVPERATPVGLEWSWKLANAVHRLDPTRPVTAAIHSFAGRPMVAARGTAPEGREGKLDYSSNLFLDVIGYNYKLEDIDADHALFPERVFYASESFPQNAYDYWALAERAPHMLGEFVWTSMDYIGEAGLGLAQRVPVNAPPYVPVKFPINNAYCGDIDLIGGQKPQSMWRDVVWGISPLEMTVGVPVPEGMKEHVVRQGWPQESVSWTWPDSIGKPLAVRVYSSGDRVELWLNGRKVGDRTLGPVDKMKTEIKIAYEPGTIEAIAYRQGIEIGRKTIATASTPAKVRLVPERSRIGRDRNALAFLNVDILDSAGRVMPGLQQPVTLTINGPADLIGFGAAGPRAVGSFQSHQALTFEGRALAVLRARGKPGIVRIEAQSESLLGGAATIRLE